MVGAEDAVQVRSGCPARRLQTCNVFAVVCPRVVIDTAVLLISPIDGHHPKLSLGRVPRHGLPVVQAIDDVLTSSDAYSTAQSGRLPLVAHPCSQSGHR